MGITRPVWSLSIQTDRSILTPTMTGPHNPRDIHLSADAPWPRPPSGGQTMFIFHGGFDLDQDRRYHTVTGAGVVVVSKNSKGDIPGGGAFCGSSHESTWAGN